MSEIINKTMKNMKGIRGTITLLISSKKDDQFDRLSLGSKSNVGVGLLAPTPLTY